MREIKFRVRCKSSKKLIGYEHFNTTLNDGYYYTLESEPEGERVCHTNYSEQPMPQPLHPLNQILREQYTGLTDKNGVEIYEGDIVLYDDTGSLEVYYDSADANFAYGVDKLQECRMHDVSTSLVEVIGNIYENPELMEA